MKFKNTKIGVIGMGYVGLPLAVEFSHHFSVVGFDINPDRVSDLNKGIDSTNEVERTSLNKLKNLLFTSEVDG
jgi:UDP-N-acetyl-D-galactosamine dehydrogenase